MEAVSVGVGGNVDVDVEVSTFEGERLNVGSASISMILSAVN